MLSQQRENLMNLKLFDPIVNNILTSIYAILEPLFDKPLKVHFYFHSSNTDEKIVHAYLFL